MQKEKSQPAMRVWLAFACCVLLFAGSASAATEKILHDFTGGNDGSQPDAGLTPGPNGSFYGTTFYGGTANQGVVYQLTPSASGWDETVLYNFQGGSTDGGNPSFKIVLDAEGNIYGTTLSGGRGYGIRGEPGSGIVYELSPESTGWKETIIHYFANEGSSSGLIMDSSGNLYGETGGGGIQNNGTVFMMKHTSSGWKYGNLYEFKGGNDGSYPYAGLIFDAKGNLYGVTIQGGPAFDGTVFELERGADGGWTENQLHVFQNTVDGVNPEAALVFDKAGNLYGTTVYGGAYCNPYGCGEVFELSYSDGTWKKSTIYSFPGAPDGHAPSAPLSFDSAGNLWSTTSNGGSNDSGALFELMPQKDGGWQESIVYSFLNGSDGGYPSTPLLIDDAGNIWGTTQVGGTDTQGVAFEFPSLAK
ncbi:MAG: choice-of-anchor tandem repeat GloVer-containing protein [Candidatus Sulfotelmatobacter sp.]